MDKKVVNKEQFRKLVIEEAKKFISEEDLSPAENTEKETKRRVTFDKVEGLISEMESMNKSIKSLTEDLTFEEREEMYWDKVGVATMEVKTHETFDKAGIPRKRVDESKEGWKPKQERDLDVNEHNKKKNFKHINESEKDRIKRMLDYNVPKDDER
jgi:hypothetical protein